MKHFTISERLKSDTALKNKLWNGAPKEAEENLRSLVEQVLDPLRERYGKPIRVTSGYRCPKLNTLVGGAPNSQHMRGEAADIVARSKGAGDCGSSPAMRASRDENLKLGQMIESLGAFDQLIYEQCDAQGRPAWIHVSYRRWSGNRHQVLYR